VASLAALSAFQQFGWNKVQVELQVVWEQLKLVQQANEEDNMLDEDGDGVADVDQIAANELAQRKIEMAMKSITEPARLQRAFGGLFSAYLAVLATLRLEFARTTAFALSIAEMVSLTVLRAVLPAVTAALGQELAHWAKTIIETSLFFVAIIFAWLIQTIISAFYSGLRGGKMFADALIQELIDRDLLDKVPFVQKPFDPDESYLDEVIGYAIAAAGFSFQLFNGFQVPFPLDILFLPLTILEWFLKIQISWTSSPGSMQV